MRHAIHIVRATRVREEGQALKVCRDYLAWGAGPRASQFLVLAAKAKALLTEQGYPYVEMKLDHKVRTKVVGAIAAAQTVPQVFVNGERIAMETRLSPGDEVAVGSTHMLFEPGG